MTDNTNFEQQLSAMQQPVPEPTPAVEPAPVAQPVVAEAKISPGDVQTAENTLFKKILPPAPQAIGHFERNGKVDFINGFIGLTKSTYARVNHELELWQGWVGAQEWLRVPEKERNKEGITLSQLQAQTAAWVEYCAENMPGQDIETINNRQRTIYAFVTNLADPLLLQYPIVTEKDLTNQSERSTNNISSDIRGLVPGSARGKFSLSEFMRRSSHSVNKDPYNYDLLLRNSYVALRYAKPTRLEAGELISNIARVVRGHVRTISQNLPALSNIAAVRVIWNFLRERIIQCSTKDTNDFDELADVIRITDINPIAASLLALFYPEGVNFNLNCLGPDACDWQRLDIIDPTSLVIDRKWLDTDEESAAYANMFNFACKYSREESLAFIDNTNFQRDIPKVWNKERTACFVLGVPSLTESFEAEAFFSEMIEKKLDSIREQSMTEEQYFNDRDDFLNGLVGTDYLHYVSEYHVMPEPGSDAAPTIIRRREQDPKEFNRGITNIIEDNIDMATELVSVVIQNYPFMSKTFVGMANYACEKCAAKSAAYEDLGYTPINIVSTFFTLANLTYTGRSKVGENVRQEALLALSR